MHRVFALTLVLVFLFAAAAVTSANEPPRYNADNFRVAAFGIDDDRVEVWGACNVDDICQLIALIDPTELDADTTLSYSQPGTDWKVNVMYIETTDSGQLVFRAITMNEDDVMVDDKLEFVLYPDDETWAMQEVGSEFPVFVGKLDATE